MMIALIIKQNKNKLAADGVNKGGQSKTLNINKSPGANQMINIYSITAATKILGRKDILKLEIWARIIFVKFTNGQARFVSKKDFWIEFHRSRKERAKQLIVSHYGRDLYQVSSQSQAEPYFVSVCDDIQCECADYAEQVKAKFKHPMCKHGWALVNHLGFSSLTAYIQSNQGKAA